MSVILSHPCNHTSSSVFLKYFCWLSTVTHHGISNILENSWSDWRYIYPAAYHYRRGWKRMCKFCVLHFTRHLAQSVCDPSCTESLNTKGMDSELATAEVQMLRQRKTCNLKAQTTRHLHTCQRAQVWHFNRYRHFILSFLYKSAPCKTALYSRRDILTDRVWFRALTGKHKHLMLTRAAVWRTKHLCQPHSRCLH